MKLKHMILVSLILAILTIGAVSASDDGDALAIDDATEEITETSVDADLIAGDGEDGENDGNEPVEDTRDELDYEIDVPEQVEQGDSDAKISVEVDGAEGLSGNISIKINKTEYLNEEVIPYYYDEDNLEEYGGNYLYLSGLGLEIGTYTVVVSYDGNDAYQPFSKEYSMEIIEQDMREKLDWDVYGLDDYDILFDDEDDYLAVMVYSHVSGNFSLFIGETEYINQEIFPYSYDEKTHRSSGGNRVYLKDLKLKPGEYDVTVKFAGDEYYKPAQEEFTLSLIFMDVEVDDVETGYIRIDIANSATGKVEIFLNDTSYKNLTAEELKYNPFVDLDDLEFGYYNYTITYVGDDYELDEPFTGEFEFTYDFGVNFPDFDDEKHYYGDPVYFEIYVPSDATGDVTVTYNNKTVKVTPDKEGCTEFAISDLELGENEIVFTYKDAKYPEKNITKYDTIYIKLHVPSYIKLGDGESIYIKLPSNATGNLLIYNGTISKNPEDDGYGYDAEEGEYIYDEEDFEEGSIIANITLKDGQASYDLSKLPFGTHDLKVMYDGDDYDVDTVIKKVYIGPGIKIDDNVYESLNDNVVITLPEEGNFTLIVNIIDYETGEVIKELCNQSNAKGVITLNIPKMDYAYYYISALVNDEKYTEWFSYSDWVFINDNVTAEDWIEIFLEDREGFVTVYIDGKLYSTESLNYNGNADIKLDKVTTIGNHTYEITYYNNQNEKILTKTGSFIMDYDLRSDISEYEAYGLTKEFELIIYVPEDAIGNITVNAAGKKYTATPVNGTATFALEGLVIGENNITITYNGDSKYPLKQIKETINIYGYAITVKFNEENDFEYVSIYLPENATGNLTLYKATVTYDSEEVPTYEATEEILKTVKLVNGTAKFLKSDFKIGKYVIVAKYVSEDEYYVDDEGFDFVVLPDISITDEILIGNNATISMTIPNATGVVNVYELTEYGPKKLLATIVSDNGTFATNLTGLKFGTHEIIFEYVGDDQDNFFDENSYPINVMPLKVEIPKTGNKDGSVVITLELPEGFSGKVSVYEVYEGDFREYDYLITNAKYNSTNKTITVTGLSSNSHTLLVSYKDSANDVFEYEGTVEIPKEDTSSLVNIPETVDSGSFDVVLPGATGGIFVTVDGNKTTYVPFTNGTAKVDLSNLSQGKHDVTIKYAGDDKYAPFEKTSTVNIASKTPAVDPKITAKDLKVIYSAGSKYTVTVYGADGKVAAGVKVTFLINGKTFKTVTTNAKGIATVKITQKPGTYKITTKALGKEVTKKLTVKHVLKLKKVKVKRSAKKLVLKATLSKVNGKYLKGKKITFKFKGKKYTAKTNKKGVAKVTIKKKVLKKLKKGKKVTYQATYLKDTVKYSVKVKK